METKNIDLKKFRGNQSSLFTGRPQGIAARKELDLDKFDQEQLLAIVKIPDGTTSFNPSFFLGLFFNSIKSLGVDEFKKKYQFTIEDQNIETKAILNQNIEEGIRSALNTIDGKTGIKRFL